MAEQTKPEDDAAQFERQKREKVEESAEAHHDGSEFPSSDDLTRDRDYAPDRAPARSAPDSKGGGPDRT